MLGRSQEANVNLSTMAFAIKDRLQKTTDTPEKFIAIFAKAQAAGDIDKMFDTGLRRAS
jgi:hypothetical protein